MDAKFQRENGLSHAEPGHHRTGGKQVLYNALMATIKATRSSSRALLGELSGMVALAGGESVPVVCTPGTASAAARGAREGDHAEDRGSSTRRRTRPGRLSRSELKAITDAGEASHIWVMTDDMYEHLV